MPFTIIAENCTGCSACEKRCPTRAISGDPKKSYFIEATMCIDCGSCGVICPDDAILDTFGNMTRCGVCIDVCPFDSLSVAPGNTATYLGKVIVDEKSCVGCRLCEEVCGWDGIYIMPGGEKGAFLAALGYDAEEGAGAN